MPRNLSDLGAARLAKEQALAKLRQLQSAALEGTLIPVDEARRQWGQAFAALRDLGLGMADRIVQRGAGRSEGELREVVNSEVRGLLEAVARGEF